MVMFMKLESKRFKIHAHVAAWLAASRIEGIDSTADTNVKWNAKEDIKMKLTSAKKTLCTIIYFLV